MTEDFECEIELYDDEQESEEDSESDDEDDEEEEDLPELEMMRQFVSPFLAVPFRVISTPHEPPSRRHSPLHCGFFLVGQFKDV